MRYILTAINQTGSGKQIEVRRSRIVIGRGEECQLRPKCPRVGRQHCELGAVDDQVLIRDLGSKNGTLVNGEKISKVHLLKHGDLIAVGSMSFRMTFPDSPVVPPEESSVILSDEDKLRTSDTDICRWLDEQSVVISTPQEIALRRSEDEKKITARRTEGSSFRRFTEANVSKPTQDAAVALLRAYRDQQKKK